MTFVAPLFLIALAAVAVPIVIHLVRFHRFRKVYFSNTTLLQELQTESKRQSQLRQWLILAMRVLTIVFLVLAFAQPVLTPKGGKVENGYRVVSIYIDNTYSMSREGKEGVLIEQARKQATAIAKVLPPDTRFQLVTSDKSLAPLSQDDLLKEIDEVRETSSTTTLSEVINRQRDFLKSQSAPVKDAYVISDFQETFVDEFESDSSCRVMLVPLKSQSVANIGIDSCWLEPPRGYEGIGLTLFATIHNYGDNELQSVPLRLYIDGEQRAISSVDIASDETKTVEMHFTAPTAGAHYGMIVTEDYPITFDDTLFFALNMSGRHNVEVISSHGENPHLRSLFAYDSLFIYKSIDIKKVDYASIEDNDFVILNEPEDISSGLGETLRRYVENGGALLMIPSEKGNKDSYNQALSLFQAPRLGTYEENEMPCTRFSSTATLYKQVFTHANSDDLELPRIKGFYPIMASAESVSEELIGMADGTPYLSGVKYGQGNIYLIAAPLTSDHTDFVSQSLFVPTLLNMALFGGKPTSLYSTIGASDIVPLQNLYDGTVTKLIKAGDNDKSQITAVRTTPNGLLTAGLPLTPGNYVLDDGNTTEIVAFNNDRQESSMQFMSRSKLKKSVLQQHPDGDCKVLEPGNTEQYAALATHGKEIWRWCLIIALICMLAEVLLIRIHKSKMA